MSMETATIWLEVNTEHKDNCRLLGVTPAQAVVLKHQFGIKIPGQADKTNPITHLSIDTKTLNRSAKEELERLCKIYGDKLILKDIFPGGNPNVPMTFKEIDMVETEDAAPKAGKLHNPPQPLASLPKEETQDEESVKEATERNALKAQVEKQGDQIAQLLGAVTSLLGQLSKGQQQLQQQQVQVPQQVTTAAPVVPTTTSGSAPATSTPGTTAAASTAK